MVSYTFKRIVCTCCDPSAKEKGSIRTDSLMQCIDLGNHVNGEYSTATVQANIVMEDHSELISGPITSLESGPEGTFVGVYDGHGGPNAAQFVKDHLFENLKKNQELSVDVFSKAYLATEKEFLSLVKKKWPVNPEIACVGSCCLVGIVCEGLLYIANVGNSRVVLGRKEKTFKNVEAIQLSSEHSASIESEREELRSLHPDDPQIVVFKHNFWSVKGIIQVSRSIGDAYLKNPEFNREPLQPRFRLKEPFRRPILQAEPSVVLHKLQLRDEFLIFASDGLWEHISNQEAVDIVHTRPRDGIARILIQAALKKVAKRWEMRYSDLMKIERGVRRHFHDDITVIVVFLDPHQKSHLREFNTQSPEKEILVKRKVFCNSGIELFKMVLGIVPLHQQARLRKQMEKNFELLRLKADYLFNLRDVLNQEFTKELMQGKSPTKESRTWINRVEEIEGQVNDMLMYKKESFEFDVSLHKRLLKTLDEIALCLEKSPLEVTTDMTITSAKSKSPRTLKETEQQIKLKGKATQETKFPEKTLSLVRTTLGRGLDVDHNKNMRQPKEVETLVAPLIDPSILVSVSDDKYTEYTTAESRMHQQRSKTEQESSKAFARVKSSMSRSSSFSDILLPSSIKPAAYLEMAPARTDDIPPYESEIELVSSESVEASRAEIVVFEIEEVDQMEPKNMMRSTDYTLSLPISSAGPLPSSRENVDVLPSDGDQTEGGHGLAELETNLKRSIRDTMMRILGCLTDVTTKMVGIYGNGGIGKTSVLKALITNPETANTFDLIIFVTVSRCWSIRKIQNEIARHLQLCIDKMETESQVARKLLQALKGRKFLLILDDVWDFIDFDAVGVPDASQKIGSRVIVTSRSLDVCLNMGVDREVEVEGISKEEAWELFQKQLCKIIDIPDIQSLARAIVEECGGLPLTIIVTGNALRGENDVQVWKHTLEEFRFPRKQGFHGTESVLPQLKFAYNRLKAREKSFFLYCALFPEDQDINICKLIEYCTEEGLTVGDSGDVHKRGHEIVQVLVDAALLEITQGGISLKMHDMIRDLASWILSPDVEGCQFLLGTDLRMIRPTNKGRSSLSLPLEKYGQNMLSFPDNNEILLRADARHKKSLTEEEWKKAKMIYLMDNEVSSLPKSPVSPNLLALFLQRTYLVRVIPASFFDHMPSLQVLNLSKTRIKSLPQSLFNLIGLRALILRDCERFFILPAEIGSLKRLEILDLQGTYISNLPNEISELSCLRQFQVSFYGSNNRREFVKLPPELIPRDIVSRFHALEKLSIVVYEGDQRWSKIVESLIRELANLTQLMALSFSFPELDLLKLFLQISPTWKSKCLKMFNFVVGHDVKRIVRRVSTDVEFVYNKQGQCLRFVNGEGMVPDAIVEVLSCATALYLDHHLNIRSLSEFVIDKIHCLKICVVRECPEIVFIIEGKDIIDVVFPFLERLSIHYLWNLRRIWEGTLPTGSFGRLRILSVHACPKLNFVLARSMLQYVTRLEELVVEDCPDIKEIIVEDRIMASCDEIPSLKKLTLHYLPELVSVWVGPWPLLEQISFYNCSNLKNIGLDSKLQYTIKEIKAEKDWWDELQWEDTALFLRLQDCFIPICDGDLEGNMYHMCS